MGRKNDFLMGKAEDYFSPDIQRIRLSP